MSRSPHMTKTGIKAYFGRVVMFREWCPDCQSFAFLVGDELQCCGRIVKREPRPYVRKRVSEGLEYRRHIPEKVKKHCLEFQGFQCLYCGENISRRTAHFDHFSPRSFSRDDGEHNIVAACPECNGLKSALIFSDVAEARQYICGMRKQRHLSVTEYYGGTYEVSKI